MCLSRMCPRVCVSSNTFDSLLGYVILGKIRARGIDHEATSDRFSPQEHGKPHVAARTQSQIDGPTLTVQVDFDANHGSTLSRTVGTRDPAHIQEWDFADPITGTMKFTSSLAPSEHEADVGLAPLFVKTDLLRVE